MFRTLTLAILALPLAGAAMLAPDAALAQECLSSEEARSAVQNGQAVSLSKMVKRIQQATGGEILPTPQLCNSGGQPFYIVKVLRPDGQVETLTVDAGSGAISGY